MAIKEGDGVRKGPQFSKKGQMKLSEGEDKNVLNNEEMPLHRVLAAQKQGM